jgi:hypothetical protein
VSSSPAGWYIPRCLTEPAGRGSKVVNAKLPGGASGLSSSPRNVDNSVDTSYDGAQRTQLSKPRQRFISSGKRVRGSASGAAKQESRQSCSVHDLRSRHFRETSTTAEISTLIPAD